MVFLRSLRKKKRFRNKSRNKNGRKMRGGAYNQYKVFLDKSRGDDNIRERRLFTFNISDNDNDNDKKDSTITWMSENPVNKLMSNPKTINFSLKKDFQMGNNNDKFEILNVQRYPLDPGSTYKFYKINNEEEERALIRIEEMLNKDTIITYGAFINSLTEKFPNYFKELKISAKSRAKSLAKSRATSLAKSRATSPSTIFTKDIDSTKAYLATLQPEVESILSGTAKDFIEQSKTRRPGLWRSLLSKRPGGGRRKTKKYKKSKKSRRHHKRTRHL